MNSAKRRRCRPSRSLSRATAVYIRHRGSLKKSVSQCLKYEISWNFMKFQSSKLLRSLEISSNPSSQRFFVFQGYQQHQHQHQHHHHHHPESIPCVLHQFLNLPQENYPPASSPTSREAKVVVFSSHGRYSNLGAPWGEFCPAGLGVRPHETVALLLVVLDHPANWHGEITGKLWVRGQNVTRKLKSCDHFSGDYAGGVPTTSPKYPGEALCNFGGQFPKLAVHPRL